MTTSTTPKNPIKFFHVKIDNPDKPTHNYTVTFATKMTQHGTGSLHDVDVGVAFCSPQDQFQKSLGRKIALGRLTKWPATHNVFTGRSVDAIINLWNTGRLSLPRPQVLKNYKLAHTPQTGLTFLAST